MQISHEQRVQVICQAFSQSPEAPTSNKVQAALSANNAKEILNVVESSLLRFSDGGKGPANFIDVGCGRGLKTSTIAGAWGLDFKCAIGLDITPLEEPVNSFDFQIMLPDSLPEAIKPNTKDLAILSMVIHHSDNPGALLQAIFVVLKPGGYLVVRDHNVADMHMPEYLNTMHIISDAILGGKTCMPNAQNYKSFENWQDLFQHQGFEHIKTNYVPFSSSKPGNTTENFACVLMKPLV